MKQDQLFDQATQLTTDMHVILQLFTNYRGIDVAKDFFGLSHVYHSVHTHPEKLPKSSWSEAGFRRQRAAGCCQKWWSQNWFAREHV